MSLSNRRTRSRTAAAVALMAATIVLSACGFRPLYGHSSANPETVAELAAIEVKPVSDRAGQMMRTALQRRFNINNTTAARYQLYVTLKEQVSKLAVERNAFATRANLRLTATHRLVRTNDGHELFNGTSQAVSSYNILTSDYTTLAGQTDARERAIVILADDIHARLAIYFTGPSMAGGTPSR